VEIREFELPSIGPEEGLLRIDACGVCEADVPPFNGQGFGNSSLGMRIPVILGHEIAGTIAKVGKRAAARWGVTEGDRVILERWIPCGRCENCYIGDYRLCIRSVDGHGLFYGGSSTELAPALWGGYAEYLYLHPDTVIYPVSKHVPVEVLPLFTPLSNGISWATRVGGTRIGSTIVIQGPGQEGLGAVIASKEAGAHIIIVTGLAKDESRLKLARELGATATIVADQEDVVERVRELTVGRLADVVLDVTSGSTTEPVELSLGVARPGGTVVWAALHEGQRVPTLAPETVIMKTLSIHGVRGRHRESVKAALRIIESGKYPLERFCTHVLGLEETERALKIAGREEGEALYVVVKP
jgi:threonine dehydrogenase-like Zn-dependent dehydrogenase